MDPLPQSEKSAVIKRSLVIGGRKTSVSLENEFWDGLREIARREKTKRSELVGRIYRDRKNINLSSAIRVFVFNYFYAQSGKSAVTRLSDGEFAETRIGVA